MSGSLGHKQISAGTQRQRAAYAGDRCRLGAGSWEEDPWWPEQRTGQGGVENEALTGASQTSRAAARLRLSGLEPGSVRRASLGRPVILTQVTGCLAWTGTSRSETGEGAGQKGRKSHRTEGQLGAGAGGVAPKGPGGLRLGVNRKLATPPGSPPCLPSRALSCVSSPPADSPARSLSLPGLSRPSPLPTATRGSPWESWRT